MNKQIEEMTKLQDELVKRSCTEFNIRTSSLLVSAANAISTLLAGYHKPEWISVDERLPELNGNVRTWGELKIQPSVRVLCFCVQKSGKVFVKEGFYELWGSRVVWKIPGSIDSVTHWMPLPEAPKMRKEDEGK